MSRRKPPKDWYAPREIVFDYNQILWIIQNFEFFYDGKWPPEPTSYVDAPFTEKSEVGRAPFEDAACVRGELSWRLDQCGADGDLLVARIRGFDNIIVENLSAECKNALAYIAGKDRRQETYQEFTRRYLTNTG